MPRIYNQSFEQNPISNDLNRFKRPEISPKTDSSSFDSDVNKIQKVDPFNSTKFLKNPKTQNNFKIDSSSDMSLFRPFTHSFRFLQEVHLLQLESEHFSTEKLLTNSFELEDQNAPNLNLKLKNLRVLFGRMFMLENTTPTILANLTKLEQDILISILEKKKYRNVRKMVDTVKRAKSDSESLELFWRMNGDKRKEQNIKFVFRYAVKFLEAGFQHEILPRLVLESPLSDKENQFLFYLYYFSHCEYGLGFDKTFSKFILDPAFRKSCMTRLQKYVFPKMNEPKGKLKTKTLSKNFFALIGKSRTFVKDLLKCIFDCVAHFGDVKFLSNNNDFLRQPELHLESAYKSILGYIVGSNDKEITKMYSHWENLINNKVGTIETNSDDELFDAHIAKVIKTNIKKASFKLPWSLEELRVAFVQSYLWLLENSTLNKSKNQLLNQSKMIILTDSPILLVIDDLILT